eukprot:9495744-Pyramimonas_sp.AAC.1
MSDNSGCVSLIVAQELVRPDLVIATCHSSRGLHFPTGTCLPSKSAATELSRSAPLVRGMLGPLAFEPKWLRLTSDVAHQISYMAIPSSVQFDRFSSGAHCAYLCLLVLGVGRCFQVVGRGGR